MRSPIIAFSIMAATMSPTLIAAMPTSPQMGGAVTHPRITEVQQGVNPIPVRRQLSSLNSLGGLSSVVPAGGSPTSDMDVLPDTASDASVPPPPSTSGTTSAAKQAVGDTDSVPYTDDASDLSDDPITQDDQVDKDATIPTANTVPANAQTLSKAAPQEPEEPVAAQVAHTEPSSPLKAAAAAPTLDFT